MRSSRGGWPLAQCDWGPGSERACGPATHGEKPRDGGGRDQSDVYRPRDTGTASSTHAGEGGGAGTDPPPSPALRRPRTGTLTLARRPRRGGEQVAVVSSPHWWDFVPWPWETDDRALDRAQVSTPRVPRSLDRSRDPARLPLRHARVY